MTPAVPGRFRAVLFDAGNTLLRMNYPAIASHLEGRGHAVSVEEIEEAADTADEVHVSFNNNNRDYPVRNARMLRRLLGQPDVGPDSLHGDLFA